MCKFFPYYFRYFLSFLVFFSLVIFACMIADDLTRKKFIAETLRRDIGLIYRTQEAVVNTHLKVRTGTLRTTLSRHEAQIKDTGERVSAFLRILPYLRFLDLQYRRAYSGNTKKMKKKRAKFALYNRVVWGVIYNETFPDICAGFTNEVRQAWRKKVEEALQK